MTIRKRVRLLLAAAFQQWHQKTCGDCGRSYWVEGRDYELIAICDDCEAKILDRMGNELEKQWQQRALRGVE